MGADGGRTSYLFGEFVLQPAERRLLRDGTPVALGQRALDVLMMLIEGGGSLVTKQALLERAWRRGFVEENALQAQISALRKLIGREAIETVSGSGYRLVHPVAVRDDEPTLAAPSPSPALPRPLSSFIGRQREMTELSGLLARTRLLTLTGAGGCGKTRLATELAQGLRGAFPDGVYVVELASLSDPERVPDVVAAALGLKERGKVPFVDIIARHLDGRRALLLLDNAEHLLLPCARLVEGLLGRATGPHILVTTRERLGVAGEITFRVPSLSLPGAGDTIDPLRLDQFESVQLFVDRARLQRPHFAVTAEHADALASICRRLDGIPLAIELAAARVRTMSLDEIDRRLDSRFALVTGGYRTAPPRHRTLRALIDWSFDLLTSQEQALLGRVSVFSGGWTLDAAERTCADDLLAEPAILELLASLVDKSMLIVDEERGEMRYGVLETIRQYAAETMDAAQSDVWHGRHLAWCSKLASDAQFGIQGADQDEWLSRMDAEIANVRSALAWALDRGKVDEGLFLCVAMEQHLHTRALVSEGRAWLARFLALPSDGSRASLLTRAKALNSSGVLAGLQSDLAGAHAAFGKVLEIATSLGSQIGRAIAMVNLGEVTFRLGRIEEARRLGEPALLDFHALNQRSKAATTLLLLARVEYAAGDTPLARRKIEECRAIWREDNDDRSAAEALEFLGRIDLDEGNAASAEAHLRASAEISRRVQHLWALLPGLEALVHVTWGGTRPLPAARAWGAIQRMREEIAFPRWPVDGPAYETWVRQAQAVLADDAAFEQAWTEARPEDWDELLDDLLERPAQVPMGGEG